MSRPICANTTHALKIYILRQRESNLQTWSSHQHQSPTMTIGLRGNIDNQPKCSFNPCFTFGGHGKVIYIFSCFLQIRQTCWSLRLIDVWHKSLQLMEGIEKPHTDKYKEITNDWNYDASCTLTSLPVWDLANFSAWFLLYRLYKLHSKDTNLLLHIWTAFLSPKNWWHSWQST
jgi:hypothetical protein